MTTTEDCRHEWIETTDLTQPVSEYVCRDCSATTRGCNTCGHPLATSLLTCDRCLNRARKVIRDIVHDLDTVPFTMSEVIGLRAVRYDRVVVTTSDDDARLPHGLDRVVEDPEAVAQRIGAAKYPQTAIDVLVGWAQAWADQLDTTVGSSWSGFLLDHTTWAATNPDQSGWHDYLREARVVRAVVRRLLGIAPEQHPAPCVHCGGKIVQKWTPTGLDDTLECTRCKLTWRDRSWLDYANLHTVHELPTTHPDALVTVADAKNIYRGRVRPNLFDLWVHRGVLKPSLDDAGKPRRDVRGVELYRLGDIAARVDAKDQEAAS